MEVYGDGLTGTFTAQADDTGHFSVAIGPLPEGETRLTLIVRADGFDNASVRLLVRRTVVATAPPTTPPFLRTPSPQTPRAAIPRPPTAPPVTPPSVTPRPPSDLCGAPPNPWGYNFCRGSLITSPPSDFCSYFSCIGNFWNGKGYVIECSDGMFGKSGGRLGSCSHHGGNSRALYAPD